jgi:hypothetical protein
MSKKAAQHHTKASEHLKHAAHHHESTTMLDITKRRHTTLILPGVT